MSASLALPVDGLTLRLDALKTMDTFISQSVRKKRRDKATAHQHSLGIVAGGAEDVLLDETVENLLQLVGVVLSVDDVALVLHVEVGLCTELASEVLGRI